MAMKPAAQEAQAAAGLVRLRVSFKGRFLQGEGGAWRYNGGDHFLESVPDTTRYTDLMFALSEKVDGAVSVKYQLPGEELDPDSLISVNDDADIRELFDEYQRALRLPGTPVKTFRLRLFLFPAAEDPLTPEDLAFYSQASRSSSVDKLARDSGAAGAGSSAQPSLSGAGGEGREAAPGLARAFARVAAAKTPSSFSSELSSSSARDGDGSPDGAASSVEDTELAWEAGFLAGQEAAALAAQEEWQALVARRMAYLGHVQSDFLLSAQEAEVAQAAVASWRRTEGGSMPWEHSMGGADSGLNGGGAAGGGLDDIDYDPDADEAAEAAEEAAAEARRFAAASQPGSLAASRQPSPRAPSLAGAAAAAPLPPTLLPPQLAAALPPRRASAPLDSPLLPQASVVMEEAEPDAEFQSMFESKYEAGAAAASTRRSPSLPEPGGTGGASVPPAAAAQWASNRSISAGASMMAAAAGGGAPPNGSGAGSMRLSQPGSSRGGSPSLPTKPASEEDAGGGAGAHSPNSLLPTHISVFGDGLRGLELRHAPAAARPSVQLPSHISEFGGDDEGLLLGGEDSEQNANRDANAMSVMKAALPDDEGDLLADAMDALRRAPLPPDAVQLPTSFELLGGGGGTPAELAELISPRLRGDGGGERGGPAPPAGGLAAEAGALAAPPAELQRSPSLDKLLSKVQRIDASQVAVLAKIGEGAFGEVSLAHCSTYGNVAVKWIKPTKVERHWASFWHEAELMSRLNHPNVLRFFGLVVEGPMVVGIMTEFAAAGSLASYLRSGVGFIPLRQRAQLALHAVNGMAYLHSLKVVHFDVKPDNLLVDGDWTSERGPVVKVADFGLSKHKYNTFCSNVHDLRGTLPYMAPEMIMDHQHVTEKADVWSLGVVFWEMLTLEVPFADMPPAQLIGALGLGKLRLAIPEWCEPDWRVLMESCWVEDPALRPSCRQLATHLERIRDMAR